MNKYAVLDECFATIKEIVYQIFVLTVVPANESAKFIRTMGVT